MAELEKQVRRVWRRLNFQRFMEILVWCWVAALAVNLCWVVTEKLWHPIIEPWWAVSLGTIGLGTAAAVTIWFFRRSNPVEAAVALDNAFGLKERVSSTLTLPGELRESPAGLALVSDTLKRVEMIDVAEKFNFRMPRTAWLPLVPAVLVFLVAMFVGQLGGSDGPQAKAEQVKERAQIKESVEVRTKRLDEEREKAKAAGLTETEKLLGDLAEKVTKDVAQAKDIDQKTAMAKINQFQDALKERRDKLGSSEQLQRQLEKLKIGNEDGPADKLQQALKNGDLKKAADEIGKIAEQLKNGNLDDAQKEQLKKQLESMKKQLEKLGDMSERRKQLEQQLKQAGMSEEQIKKELEKLDAQQQEMQKLQELAQKLGDCQKALEQGDMQKALDSLGMSKEDLQQLMKDLQEMKMLEQAMDQLAEMKEAMACKNCGGGG